MKTLTNILLLLFPLITFGQGFNSMDTINAPAVLSEKIPENIKTTFLVDFTGDGIQDYICQTDFLSKTEPYYIEYWITSEFEIKKKKTKYLEEFNFFWLVNIDDDPEPEIFSASGWSEGIDYCFINQNLDIGEDSILFYFNPIIIENNNDYWGYPWDIHNLLIKQENNKIKLLCSMNHDIQSDGEITIPDWQTIFPVICFSGHSNQQNIKVEEIRELKWTNINEIKYERTTKAHMQ